MKYIIDIPNEMVIKSPLKGLTLGIAMIETSTQKQFIIPTNIPLISHIEPQKWIPCSERLPEEGIEVLGTDDHGCIRHVVKDKSALYEFATYEEMMHINIVAWQPLPEPWKGGEEE